MRPEGCQSHMDVSLEAEVPRVPGALMSAAGKQQKLRDVDRSTGLRWLDGLSWD